MKDIIFLQNYKYSSQGKKQDWSTVMTKNKYNEKKECLIQHYGQYSASGNLERVCGTKKIVKYESVILSFDINLPILG